MNIFKMFGGELNYKDILQLDGAFSVSHINYKKSPKFNKNDGKDIAKTSRKNSLSDKDKVENVIKNLESFNGTEKKFKMNDRIELWKNYWLEYVNAFNILADSLPNSIVTVFIGRQASKLVLNIYY